MTRTYVANSTLSLTVKEFLSRVSTVTSDIDKQVSVCPSVRPFCSGIL